MNFAADRGRDTRGILPLLACSICAFLAILLISGCSDNVTLPDQAQLAAFNSAGPILPEIDVETLLRVRSMPREYRARTGDVLSLRIPQALLAVTQDEDTNLRGNGELLCRVDEEGAITLPIVERVTVAGKRLIEIEAEIVGAYYPKYAVSRPTIVARVSEYDTSRVVITGAVRNPGLYELPKDRMTLVSAIMAAGGIAEGGAAGIRIHYPATDGGSGDGAAAGAVMLPDADRLSLTFQQRAKQGTGTLMLKDGARLVYAEDLDVTSEKDRNGAAERISRAHPEVSANYVLQRLCQLAEVIEPGSVDKAQLVNATEGQSGTSGRSASAPSIDGDRSLLLPIKGANIPFSDVALSDGVGIEVQPLDQEVFTVMGLVKRPGVFPYPSSTKYNLLQAISFAGGVDDIADPRYVRVYRQDGSGRIVDAAFELIGAMPVSASTLVLKPGDVVAVEQTPRTHWNTLIKSMVGIRFGAGYYPNLSD